MKFAKELEQDLVPGEMELGYDYKQQRHVLIVCRMESQISQL